MTNKIKTILKDLKLPATKKDWINMDNYTWDSQIIDKIKNRINFEYGQEIQNVRQKFQLRQKYDFSIVKKGKSQYVFRAEEALERFITMANQTNNSSIKFGNQFNILSKRGNIDLVKKKDNTIVSIFEIKDFDGPDSPIYAAVELLKNEILLSYTSNDVAQCLKKVVLAPKEYFALHAASLKTVKTIEKILAFFTPIQFTYIDIKQTDFNKAINDIGNNQINKLIKWKNVNNNKFDCVKKVSFELEDIKGIEKSLKENKWQTIYSPENWPRE